MITRRLAVLIIAAPASVGTITVAGTSSAPGDHHRRTISHGRQVAFDGHGPEWWAQQAHRWQRRYRRVRYTLLERPNVVEAINLACATYGSCSTLWRKARCETGGTYSPLARNPSGASGLYQFLESTWTTTPYGRFSVWSPYANALAAGWMHAHNRGGEWTCR